MYLYISNTKSSLIPQKSRRGGAIAPRLHGADTFLQKHFAGGLFASIIAINIPRCNDETL